MLEFIIVMGEKMTSVNRKGDLEKTFNYFDAGKIEFDISFMSKISLMAIYCQIKIQDGSGTIGQAELYEVMKRFNKGITKEQVDQILEQVDSDGSGKISFEGKTIMLLIMSEFFVDFTLCLCVFIEFLKLMNCWYVETIAIKECTLF